MIETQGLYQAVMYLNCIFELYLLYRFLEGTFSVYEDRKGIRFLECVGFAVIVFIINSFHLPTLNLICIPLIYLLFAWMLFRIEFKYNVLYVLLFYLTLSIIEFIFHYLYKTFEINPMAMESSRIILLMIQNVLRMVVIQMFNKQHHTRMKRYNESYRHLKFLFVLPIASFLLMNGFIVSEDSPFRLFLICFGGGLMIASNIIEFSIVEKLLKVEQIAKEREMFAQKTALEQIYYNRLEEINQSNAEYMHEMNHFIRTMEQLACTENNDIIQQLASDISQKSKPLINKYYIDDKITNAIFLEREKRSAELNVQYQVNIQPGIDLKFIEDTDKISMFGNLLDNALEAAAVSEKGFVSVSLFTGSQAFVVFKVENNFRLKPQKQGNRYLTGKRNKEQHGFGIKKVEELAEKYKGVLNITQSENTFTVILILSSIRF